MTNESGYHPLEYNVLVKPHKVQEKTPGGIFLPDDIKSKDKNAQTRGWIVDLSPMAFANPDWPAAMAHKKPKVGDKVMYARYSGATSTITGNDGEEYVIIKDNEIIAVIEEVKE